MDFISFMSGYVSCPQLRRESWIVCSNRWGLCANLVLTVILSHGGSLAKDSTCTSKERGQFSRCHFTLSRISFLEDS